MTEVRQTNNSLIGFILSAFNVTVDGLSRQTSDDRKESSQNRSWQIVGCRIELDSDGEPFWQRQRWLHSLRAS
jgi:hypothetical protein